MTEVEYVTAIAIKGKRYILGAGIFENNSIIWLMAAAMGLSSLNKTDSWTLGHLFIWRRTLSIFTHQ